jgi:signal transduction histidine kinase
MTQRINSSDGHVPRVGARWDAVSTQRHAVALARWISLGSFGLMVCLWLAIIVSTWSVREAALSRAASSANNLSAAFSDEVLHTLNSLSAAMDLTAREIRDNPGNARLDRWSEDLPALASQTMFASLLDAKGKLIASTTKPAALTGGIGFIDLETIKVHLALLHPDLYISESSVDRVSGRVAIQVAKRVDDASGQLIGILVFGLALDDLTSLYRSLDLSPRSVIALVGEDGLPRARFGSAPRGFSSAMGGLWPVLLDHDKMKDIVRSGAADGVSRIYSLRRIPNYPLIVAAGLSLDDELAESRTHPLLEVCIGVAATVLLGVLNLLLVREIRRRGEREIDLAQQHSALEAARAELLLEQGKLAAVNQELLFSMERAEAASLAKSQFLAQMSHELRTPLHAVIGFSEVIRQHVASMPSSELIAGYATDIMKSGRHLLALINSILDLSKVESGTVRLAEDHVPLEEVIQDSLTTIRQQAAAADVTVDTNFPAEIPMIRGDATKLRQIFINLLSNAVKFTQAGGSLTILGRREADGGFAVIVSDTGIGMNDTELAVAMEPFGQVENSLARTFEGTGLGLPLARRMTELHGGRFTVRSVKGVGTTVEVYLPASRILWAYGARKSRDAPAVTGR